MNQIHHK